MYATHILRKWCACLRRSGSCTRRARIGHGRSGLRTNTRGRTGGRTRRRSSICSTARRAVVEIKSGRGREEAGHAISKQARGGGSLKRVDGCPPILAAKPQTAESLVNAMYVWNIQAHRIQQKHGYPVAVSENEMHRCQEEEKMLQTDYRIDLDVMLMGSPALSWIHRTTGSPRPARGRTCRPPGSRGTRCPRGPWGLPR